MTINIPYPLLLSLIEDFYELAKRDILIGYHFRNIQDFDEHIPRIADFWNLQVNGEVLEKSHLPYNLLGVHKELGIKSGEMGRWTVLMNQTMDDYLKRKLLSQDQYNALALRIDHFRKRLTKFLI
ncbi:MAG: hypothetical protein CME62_15235 [Halobacteriovoraceae bacterium]|nr:hypothetical protein [Halobacteriovoraceae bacterium]|tara:strand:+ start:19480 stop:19854 length:375 start_codon:yes stop_codon:yes gene_type:complete